MTTLLRTITLFAALLLPSLAAAQTTIELRESATATAGTPVRLDQVAELSGPDAAKLAGVVVLTTGNATAATLSRDSIKAAINAGHPAVNWARTILRGGDISLTFTAAAAAPAPAARVETPARTDPVTAPQSPAPSTPPPTQPSHATSLRNLILRALADAAGIDIADDAITLRLDTLPPADQQLLAQPVPATWKCRIQVLGATPAGRTSIRIEAFESDHVALNRTLTIDALVTRNILIVAAPGGLARDQVIAATDLRLDRRTLPVNESARTAAVTSEALIGSVVKRRLDQGKPILPGDVATPKATVVAKRGDDITVSCISGGVILKTKAKAIGPARDGELVTLQIEGSKKTFTARMNGPGKAVMSLDAQ